MDLLSVEMLAVFAVFGVCAGVAAGLLGIGGGVILVPLFMWSFKAAGINPQILVHSAFATSLAIIIPTAISNTMGHLKRSNVRGDQVIYLAVGAVVGALLGSWAASLLDGAVLQLAFGIMQIAVALKMITGSMNTPSGELCSQKSLLILTGLVGGAYSAFFGVGGGVVAVPLMVLCLRFPMHLAVGNSAALIIASSFFGTCSYVYAGWDLTTLTDGFLGYVFLPAVAMVIPFSLLGSRIGVHFAGRFSHARLVASFAALLVVIGLRVIWSAL
ncbi:MAG: sulfite exporter TauE/SafE family protein [Desulfuromonas sp.]|nr:sulfite exporter TauE/SafE family protein [Desulfuromonas sp.]